MEIQPFTSYAQIVFWILLVQFHTGHQQTLATTNESYAENMIMIPPYRIWDYVIQKSADYYIHHCHLIMTSLINVKLSQI